MRIVLASLAAATVSVVAAADAVVRENGPIFFYGSRASDFYSEIYSVAADGTGRTNLSSNPAADGQPAVSPDGKRVAFVSHRDGFDAIYLMNADGSGQEQLVGRLPNLASPYRIGGLVWPPGGRRLAFTATQPPVGSFFESSSIYLVDLSSRRVRWIWGVGCGGGGVAFSRDGRFVAYASASCRPVQWGVIVKRADGRTQLTVGGRLVGWAPRRNSLLFLRNTRNPRIQHVATVDSSGHLWVLRGIPANAAAWSPAGGLIAFSPATRRRPGIYVVRPGGRRPRRVVALANASLIGWSPNGAWLALAAARASSEGGMTIYIVRPNGRGLRRVAGARTLPVWSRDSSHLAFVGLDGTVRVVSPPDPSALRVTDPAVDAVGHVVWGAGGRLLFTASGPGPRSTHLLAVEPDGSGVRQVSPGATPVGAISPDGSRVAFVRDADIWTSRLDGSDERQVTSGAALDGIPAWSPDGQRLAFSRRPSGSASSDIFVVESSGGSVRYLTYRAGAGAPAWSSDGDWIAFLVFGGLHAVHPDGTGLHRISTVGGRVYEGTEWSPDGTRIALGGCAIAVVNADGSGYRELTGSGVREGEPSWSPDGTKIVFTRSAVPCPGDFTGDSDLWTINSDGSGETRLTDGPWPDTLPSWQPVRP